MPFNMGKMPYQVCNTILTPGVTTIVAEADVAGIRVLTLTVAVSTNALNLLEVWVKGDPDGAYFLLPQSAYLAYGRTDAGTDITTTPPANSCFVQIDVTGWRTVQLKVRSALSARAVVTAGGQS